MFLSLLFVGLAGFAQEGRMERSPKVDTIACQEQLSPEKIGLAFIKQGEKVGKVWLRDSHTDENGVYLTIIKSGGLRCQNQNCYEVKASRDLQGKVVNYRFRLIYNNLKKAFSLLMTASDHSEPISGFTCVRYH